MISLNCRNFQHQALFRAEFRQVIRCASELLENVYVFAYEPRLSLLSNQNLYQLERHHSVFILALPQHPVEYFLPHRCCLRVMELHISELVIQLQLLVDILFLFCLCLQIICFGEEVINILVCENAVLDSVGQHVLTGLEVSLECASARSAISLLRFG